MESVARSCILGGFVWVAVLTGCEVQKSPAPPEQCPDCNVILITFDALRADRMGLYGYSKNNTPNLDLFAEEAFVFKDNMSQSGTTISSAGLDGAASVNVQQYVLGSTNNVEAQGAGTPGNDGTLPNATDLEGVRDPDKSGMYALEDVDLFNILCLPRAAQLYETDPNQMSSVPSKSPSTAPQLASHNRI